MLLTISHRNLIAKKIMPLCILWQSDLSLSCTAVSALHLVIILAFQPCSLSQIYPRRRGKEGIFLFLLKYPWFRTIILPGTVNQQRSTLLLKQQLCEWWYDWLPKQEGVLFICRQTSLVECLINGIFLNGDKGALLHALLDWRRLLFVPSDSLCCPPQGR